MSTPPARLDYKDFVQTLPRMNYSPQFPEHVEYNSETLYAAARGESDVELNGALTGSTIMLLYRHSGYRFGSTCILREVKHEVIRGGLRQTVVVMQRSDASMCEIALSLSHYWTLESDWMSYVWFVMQ